MTYARALRRLEERQETRVRLGLARLRRLLKALGDPQEAVPAVHVAGTNGKGSVCAMLDAVLRASGRRVGLYTSPHLHDVRERIRVDGRLISRTDFASAIQTVLRAEREPLSYFELVTAAAFVHFRRRRVEAAVLETGLGGRLDATNVVRHPLASLVPAVGIDHTEWLGSDLRSIAGEKGGIFKRGAPALTAEAKPEALEALRRAARRRGALWQPMPARGAWTPLGADWSSGRQRARAPGLGRVTIGLLGAAQVRNAELVSRACRTISARGFPVSDAALRRGLAAARWPGRFELVRRGGRLAILDGAHNPQAMEHFCRTLRASPWARTEKLFILGVLADKDYRAMLDLLAPCLQRVVVTRPASPRALAPERLAAEVAARAPRAEIRLAPDARAALRLWRQDGPRVACVVGSFYLVGSAARVLAGGKPRRAGPRWGYRKAGLGAA